MWCWAQCPWVFLICLGVTLDSAETPFAKISFSCLLIAAESHDAFEQCLSSEILGNISLGARKKKRRKEHINKIFAGLSQDFGAILFMCFSPPSGMTPKNASTNLCHLPGQSPKFWKRGRGPHPTLSVILKTARLVITKGRFGPY